MRVPVIDAPSVDSRPIGTQYQQTQGAGEGSFAVAKGLGQLAQGVSQVEAERSAAAAKARKEAATIQAQDGLTELQHYTTNTFKGTQDKAGNQVLGYFSSVGEQAARAAAPTLEKIQAQRNQIEARMTSPEAKQLFKQHADSLYEQSYHKVEAHQSRQFELAKAASAEALRATALNEVASNYSDPVVEATQSKLVEDSIRSRQLNQAQGDALVAEWKQDAASVRLSQFIAQRDYAGAEAVFSQAKDVLGVHAPQFQREIGVLREKVEAVKAADSIFKSSVNPASGWADQAKAIAAFQDMPSGPSKEEAGQLLQRQLSQNEALKKKAGTDAYNRALSAYLQNGTLASVSAQDKAFLLDPANDAAEHWQKLKQIARSDADHARVRNSGGAEARREQAAFDRQALLDFRTMPAEERSALDVGSWLAGRGVSDVGVSAIKAEQTAVKAQVQKGDAVKESEFRLSAKSAAQGVVKSKTDKATYEAEAVNAFQEFYQQNKRPPNREESSKLIADLLATSSTKPGLLWGTNEEAGFARRARERKDGGGVVAPVVSPKPSKLDRAKQLKAEGKSLQEAKAILAGEGY